MHYLDAQAQVEVVGAIGHGTGLKKASALASTATPFASLRYDPPKSSRADPPSTV
jgi:hypothetical protein